MANIIINNIDIGCDDSEVLYEIIDKYTTGGDLDFNKIRPIPDELHVPEPFSSSLVKALSDYLSIINPHNKKYKDDPLRQKYSMVTCDEMQNILNKLGRYGDPGLISILQIDFPPSFVKTHFDHAINRDLMWIPLTIKTMEDWIDWGKAYVDNINKYGVPNSTMWAKRYWGTEGRGKTTSKCVIVGSSVLTTRIETRWDPPHVVLTELSRLCPDCIIYNKYKSEFWRGYIHAVYQGGTMTNDIKI